MSFKQTNFHESLDRASQVPGGSDRAFGFIMASACAIIAALSYLLNATLWPLWLGIAATLTLFAWLQPKLLAPLNRLWSKLSVLLHRLVTPVIMCFVFFLIITPVGLGLRAMRSRPLELGFEPRKSSYWITLKRNPRQVSPNAKQY
jgi:hypothetical protein